MMTETVSNPNKNQKANGKEKNQGFFLSLDDLFDTRFATLKRIDEEIAEELLMSGYFSRLRDEFPGIDLHTFRKRYQERDIVTLANSNMTSITLRLGETIRQFMVDITKSGVGCRLKLYVNMYPYKLSDEEKEEIIKCLAYRINVPVEIIPIYLPYELIDPMWLDDHVSVFYCYDWDKWLRLHCETLFKRRLDDVVMVSPMLYPLSKEEGEQQIRQLEEEYKYLGSEMLEATDEETFNYLQNMIRSGLINIDFFEVRDFCTFLPDECPTPPGSFD